MRRISSALPKVSAPRAPLSFGFSHRTIARSLAPVFRPTPSLTSLPLHEWPLSSRRELFAHLRDLGIDERTSDPLGALKNKEIERAQKRDALHTKTETSRITAKDFERLSRLADEAQNLNAVPQTHFFGFSRLIDAKFELTPRVLSALAEEAIDPRRSGSEKALLRAIDRGPKDGARVWRTPRTRHQLVASLVRHLVFGNGASLQISLSPSLEAWLERVLRKLEQPVQQALGGAGGFCANIASLIPQVEPHFYSFEDLPRRLADRISMGVKMLDHRGRAVKISERVCSSGTARINYAAKYGSGQNFEILGRKSLLIDGKEQALTISGRGRFILGTQAVERSTFGDISEKALQKIGAEHDLFFLSGLHYHTADPSDDRTRELARQLDLIRKANPRALVHFEYAVPKIQKNEARMMALLKGRIDSLSLNSVELGGLLGHSETSETAETMLRDALRLREKMNLSRVHVHGYHGDLLIVDGAKDPKRQVLALLRARQFASMKSANASGELKTPTDVWPIHPVVQGEGIAELHAFADAMAARLGLGPKERDEIAERCWARDANTLYVFVPNRGIHDDTGGTVGAGDTIDSTALMFGVENTNRPKKPVHPAFFSN